ncbi:MAG: periplasmic Cu(I)/Cu(II)-binding protein CopK [Betaproteobacteria bacterium]|nr:periplasmic Cu(I)/Cu(II)-binding protein CopK [Betaproteobacteria bacterium]
MLKKIVVAAGAMIALSAFAAGHNQAERSVELKDGSTVHIFNDGKMGMEDQFGRAAYMEPGHTMETRDGKKITMNGNEVWRVDALVNENRLGG